MQDVDKKLVKPMVEGLDGGGGAGIHFSLKKISPLFISLKFWVIHQNKTTYPL